MINKLIKWYKKNLFIRKNLNIGYHTVILTKLSNFGSEPYLVKIGANCLITSGVQFITHDGSISVLMQKFANKDLTQVYGRYNIFGAINIGNNVFIGLNSIIMPNVTIGDNVIIGAGSIVTRSISSDGVYAGNPAKFICSLSELNERTIDRVVEIHSKDNEIRKTEILTSIRDSIKFK